MDQSKYERKLETDIGVDSDHENKMECSNLARSQIHDKNVQGHSSIWRNTPM
jgi:hypothetical protein